MLRKVLYKIKINSSRWLQKRNLRKKNIYIGKQVNGFWNVDFEGANKVPERCHFFGNIKIGYASTLGVNNFFGGNIEIGKYCQIGVDVAIHTANHPINYLSTYVNKNLFNEELKQLIDTSSVVKIGHDVWIGHGVKIIGNVTIGNGAILAAGSIVTKDVAPYSIVGGIPAKKINSRFDDPIIKEIQDLNWWDKNPEELEKLKPLFFKNFKNKNSIYEE